MFNKSPVKLKFLTEKSVSLPSKSPGTSIHFFDTSHVGVCSYSLGPALSKRNPQLGKSAEKGHPFHHWRISQKN